MGFNSDLTVKDSDIVIRPTPSLIAESTECKNSLICMDQLDLVPLRVNHHLIYVSQHISVKGDIKVYYLFNSTNILVLDTISFVSSMNERCRNPYIRKLTVKHNSSLLETKMSPILQNFRTSYEINMASF